MAAHRGHWTAGLRGLWCLGGGGGRGPRRHRRKGGLTALDILPATRGYHQWDSMRDHVRPPRYTRKSVVRFRVYPTDASLFHCVHTYPLVVSAALLLARSSFLGEDWTRRIVELVVTSRFFSSWGNIIVIVTFVIIVFGNISEIWD